MKLFPKWKTVNKISHGLTADVTNIFQGSHKTTAILLVQEKDKVFSEGIWYRCLIKTAVLTDTMDTDLVMAELGVETYEELREYKI